MFKTISIGFILVVMLAGCAPRQAATTWGYSHWYEKYGAGDLEAFQGQQKSCLDRVGVENDPTSVGPGSPQEDAFLECMNNANWCTTDFHCREPGA